MTERRILKSRQLLLGCGENLAISLCRLSFAVHLLTVPLIPSHGILPCTVAKKFSLTIDKEIITVHTKIEEMFTVLVLSCTSIREVMYFMVQECSTLIYGLYGRAPKYAFLISCVSEIFNFHLFKRYDENNKS